ncbi:MAG: hypothetical protein KBB21_29635 [Nannocystaceae bacterium]|nr:hypothetical protein [Deltaproteobacteria bacterium]MBP7290824.1 hypothetical protein [Nannocystaceae bacterium]
MTSPPSFVRFALCCAVLLAPSVGCRAPTDGRPFAGTAADGSSGGSGNALDASSSGSAATTSAGVESGESSTSHGIDVGSSSGGGPSVTAIDLHDVVLHDNPPELADWPITTTLTRVEFRVDGGTDGNGGVFVEFDKKDGDGRWPDIVPPGWDGPLYYTLGLVENIGGQWHASAAMQYWYGLDVNGGNVGADGQVAMNWYYDARWGEMAGHQPAQGESIGVFIVAGNLRGVLDGSQSPVQERSDVVVVPFPGPEGATHAF